MLVERYSFDGFKPQKQTHHLDVFVNIHLDGWDEFIKTVPEHLKYIIIEQHKRRLPFYKEHIKDLYEGIWVFPYGTSSRLALNHLTKPTPCWVAELPDDIDVYDCNWDILIKLSDNRCTTGAGCYVPKRSLKDIHNVQLKRDYISNLK